MPPECMEIWAKRFEIKEGLLGSRTGWLWLLGLLTGSFFLEDACVIVLQLPVFPNRWYFGWEGTPGTVQDQAGLAEGGRAILLWVL